MLKSKYIGLLFLVLAILMACQYPSPVTSSEDMPQKTRDSVNYLVERHYTLNSNFGYFRFAYVTATTIG